ncbi:hypothetical protein LTR78_009271 [Recurvomyces mirabilis]|uniref:NAD(P)-binding domain-containing protein n=1 Tax=Recurvomyces mirabilis TaxID=574656 RepID=A0AAE0TS17_9PEZI|nr:hypothetical protein LTR78_009271 [Recurvomyces mirabilis]KAK5156168.1 hypothetical protein LTS14_005055 [Recurvomyces mirabilis]
MAQTRIAIIGVTGHLGSLIAKHILNRSSTSIVHGICRTPSKLSTTLTSNPRFKTHQTDLTPSPKLPEALQGANIAIFATLADNDTMVQGQKTLIDLCIELGVPRFMTGDWSMDYRKLAYGDHPAKDPMKEVAAYAQAKEKESNGAFKHVSVLNACFMEVPWRGIYNPGDKSLQYWGSGIEKWELTTHDDAAQFSAAIALDTGTSGYHAVRGDKVNIHDMASAFETAFGFKPELKCNGSLNEMFKTMHAIKDSSPQNPWSWIPMFYAYYSVNGQTTLEEPLSNELYPDVKTTSLVEYLRAVGTPEKLGMAYDEAVAEQG